MGRIVSRRESGTMVRMLKRSTVFFVMPLLACAADVAQLASDPAVRSAFEIVKRNEPEILAAQRRVCEIAAPPFAEKAL